MNTLVDYHEARQHLLKLADNLIKHETVRAAVDRRQRRSESEKKAEKELRQAERMHEARVNCATEKNCAIERSATVEVAISMPISLKRCCAKRQTARGDAENVALWKEFCRSVWTTSSGSTDGWV